MTSDIITANVPKVPPNSMLADYRLKGDQIALYLKGESSSKCIMMGGNYLKFVDHNGDM